MVERRIEKDSKRQRERWRWRGKEGDEKAERKIGKEKLKC